MKIKIEVTAENTGELSTLDEGLEDVLKVVASNRSASPSLLHAVSASANSHVRREVAANPQLAINDLDKLINDPDAEVRAAIIEHPAAIQYVWKLISDPSPLVRYCVALHKEFPEHVYEALTNDENIRVARRARKTLQEMSGRNPVVRFIDRLSHGRLAS